MKFLEPRRSKQITPGYFQKSIGLSLPGNAFDYEFLISGKNLPYTQNQVINAFIENGARLLSLDSNTNPDENRFVLTVCCDLEKADVGPLELAVQLRDMKFVVTAEYSEIRGRLFGRRHVGLIFNDRNPAVALRSSTMINLGKRLAKVSGSLGTSALYQEGREYAHGVIQEIREILDKGGEPGLSLFYYDPAGNGASQFNGGDSAYCMKCRATRPIQDPKQVLLSNKSHALQGVCPICFTKVFRIGPRIYCKIKGGALIENAQAYLMAAGWGTFELRSAIEERLGEVVIADPPTLEGDVLFGNQFVEGIAAGLLEAASDSNNKMALVGENYDRSRRTLTLHFAEEIHVGARKVKRRTISKKKKEEATTSNPRSIVERAAIGEVDRIIHSLEKVESDARVSIGQLNDEMKGNDEKEVTVEPVKP